jgi:probable HAF family extracellular repeat protein
VGYAYLGNGTTRGYLYSGGTMTALGTLGGDSSCANSINAAGQVVGYANTSGNRTEHAALFTRGTVADLGTLGTNPDNSGRAHAINASGQVTGNAWVGTYMHAFLYSGGTMSDIGALTPTGDSYSNDINDRGEIVGSSIAASGSPHAFLYSNNVMTDLDAQSDRVSWANDINQHGDIVGGFSATPHGEERAFLYSDGALMDLNDLLVPSSGWTLTGANAINDNGWIVGNGIDPQGMQHAFLLVPTPEPSSLALIGIGAVSLLCYVWQRQRYSRQ